MVHRCVLWVLALVHQLSHHGLIGILLYMSKSPLTDSSTFVTLKDKIRGGDRLEWAGFSGFSLVLWITYKGSTCIQPIYYSS